MSRGKLIPKQIKIRVSPFSKFAVVVPNHLYITDNQLWFCMDLLGRPMLIFEGPDEFQGGLHAAWQALPQLGKINSWNRINSLPQPGQINSWNRINSLPELGQINSWNRRIGSWNRRVVLEPQRLLLGFFPHCRYIARITDGIPDHTSDDGCSVIPCWIKCQIACKTYRWNSEGKTVIYVLYLCIKAGNNRTQQLGIQVTNQSCILV